MRDILKADAVHRIIKEQRAQRSPARSRAGPGLNVLVLGGGGREYAIAWRLARSDSVATIDVAPGNAGLAAFARTIALDPRDTARLEQHVAASLIDLVVVGPDELVARGIGDALRRSATPVVAPSREASRIEWSKSFAKEVMDESGVPTAAWRAYADRA
ncbi:MAG: hypothetical protein ACRDF0_11590, partial [Candidatus Limnocylindria bacterium]